MILRLYLEQLSLSCNVREQYDIESKVMDKSALFGQKCFIIVSFNILLGVFL